jgi:hypothetical protein
MLFTVRSKTVYGILNNMIKNNKILITSSLLVGVLLLTGVVSAQENEDSLPSAGLTPNSPFYFLDMLWEEMGEFFAFSAEAKVRVKAERAAERLAEIEVMVKEKGAPARGLAVARERLERHLSEAADVIEEESGEGKDVSALAREIVDNFHKQRVAALNAFSEALDDFLTKKDALLEELRVAVQAGNLEEAERIRQELANLEAQKDAAEQVKDETIAALEKEKERLHDELENGDRAEAEARDREVEAKELAEELQREAKERAQEAQERARERELEARERAAEAEEQARERAKEAEERAGEPLREAREREKEARERGAEAERGGRRQ